GAGLARLDRRVGEELDGGPQDRAHRGVDDDGTVHLRELAQPGRGERDVQAEPARGDGLDRLVVTEHDERTRAAAQDPLETLPQRRTRRDGGEGRPQQLLRIPVGCGHGRTLVVVTALVLQVDDLTWGDLARVALTRVALFRGALSWRGSAPA